jgi:diaminohydroxyphosphoribosylaminopyrimidine deaminase/5-amino-6-(5-phosphoribosylamino)uracil reductase
MHRCLDLAKLGAGNVAPNPMVGAVLVHNERIIGEGYHRKYGEAHAEPYCIDRAVESGQMDLISQSIMYVSLEPCIHFGKTPPCADLIIRHKIPMVIIGCRDPFKEVNGKGIEKLLKAGIEVESGILEKECQELNKRFLLFHTQHRPYIILKWAQTANGKIAAHANSPEGREASAQNSHKQDSIIHTDTPKNGDTELMASAFGRDRVGADRLHISNEFTNRLVHKWRSEEAAILVGTNTALMDDPELTTRLWTGNNPTRLVIDMDLRLPRSLKIFNGKSRTIVFNKIKHDETATISYYQVTEHVSLVHQIVNALHQLRIQSVIVEGGARLLQSFIDDRIWDEARVINNEELIINNGLAAPELTVHKKIGEQKIFSDRIDFFIPATDS